MENPSEKLHQTFTARKDFLPPADEINLLDIYYKVANRRWLVLGIFLGCICAGAAYLAFAPTQYEYTSIVRIGLPPSALNQSEQLEMSDRHDRFIQAAKAKLSVVLIPGVARNLASVTGQVPAFTDLSNAVSIDSPRASDLITLSVKTSREESGPYIALMQGAIDQLVSDHRELLSRALTPRLADIERAQMRLADTARALEEKVENVQIRLQLAETEFKDLRTHLEALESIGPLTQRSNTRDSQLSLLIVKSSVLGLRARITELEQQIRAQLAEAPTASEYHSKGPLNFSKAERLQVKKFEPAAPGESELKEEAPSQSFLFGDGQLMLQQTSQLIQAPRESLHPVWPKKSLILMGSGFVGLVLGIFVALLTDFLTAAQSELRRRRLVETE